MDTRHRAEGTHRARALALLEGRCLGRHRRGIVVIVSWLGPMRDTSTHALRAHAHAHSRACETSLGRHSISASAIYYSNAVGNPATLTDTGQLDIRWDVDKRFLLSTAGSNGRGSTDAGAAGVPPRDVPHTPCSRRNRQRRSGRHMKPPLRTSEAYVMGGCGILTPKASETQFDRR